MLDKIKIDLHVHTNFSKDGFSSINEVVKYAKAKGLDGIAITDHDVLINEKVIEKISKENNIIIIPGIEVTTKYGHLIILKPSNLKNDIEELLKNEIIIIPHPLDPFSHGIGKKIIKKILNKKPLIEVKNSSTLPIYNKLAEKLAKKYNLGMVGGSDAHIAYMIGTSYTIIEVEDRNINEILNAIKDGRTIAYGGFSLLSIKFLFEKYFKKFE
ncbi:MAG: PHP domain-containing protein [Candidatus Verstraetearchaeota archaeon]|jgi:predicted metal-dependent phosphoesterase TrpH|nr:PHP domain-containing protein [Candidatus Verstraetearchaeota archaeon]